MKKQSFIAILAVLFAFQSTVIFAAGNGEATKVDASEGKVITIGMGNDAANLNPVLITELVGESHAANIFDTLIQYKDDLAVPAPGLAKTWSISDDGLTYTFNLREGVKFHNGEDFTADDVKYTISEIMNPENASPSKQFFDTVDSINIVDDFTIEFKLKEVYPAFMLALGSPQIGIIPMDYVSQVGHEAFDRAPVGTGPFIFDEWVPDTKLVMVKNADYWGGVPNLDKAIFRPIPKAEVMAVELKSGGIDMASQNLSAQDITAMQNDSKFDVQQVPGLSLQYLGFSTQMPPYNDVRFRKAIYYSTDFANAIKGIYGNTAERAYSWVPPMVLGNDLEYMKSMALPYDEAKAQALFDELIADGVLTAGQEIPILAPNDQYRSKIATAIASSLIKFGFKPDAQTVEFGTLLPATEGGKTGIYFLGWGSVADPDRWTYSLFHTEAGKQNRSMYSNPIVDAALEKGRSTVNTKERETAYVTAMRQALAEDYIHIPLTYKYITSVSTLSVKNFVPSPQGYIYLFTPENNVDIE